METGAARDYVEVLLDFQYDLLFIRTRWGVNHAEFLFAHATRWPGFHALAEKLKGTAADPWRTNPARLSSQTLLDALHDEWEDRDFYESFSGSGTWV